MATNELKVDRIAYCSGMDPEDYKAASAIAPDAVRVDCANYDKTYEAVVNGDCDACVLPFERSRSGMVPYVMDMFYKGDLSIVKVFKWEANDEVARYAVLSRKENESACEDGSRFMMIFTVKNVQGSLVKAINAISSNGFNIRFDNLIYPRIFKFNIHSQRFSVFIVYCNFIIRKIFTVHQFLYCRTFC